jgi:energy-coupling factor transport system permease protein
MRKGDNVLDHKKFTFAYFPSNSIMHRLNPLSKLFILILLTVLTLIINSLIILSIVSVCVILIALLSHISIRNLTRKLRFIVFILIFGVILNIFFNAIPEQNQIILFYLFNLPFLPIRRLAVYFSFRAFFIVLTLYTSSIIYTNTTNMKDFVYSLMRLKIPYKYCYAFMVGIRYIPTIEEEAKTISLAQRARGFGLEKAKSIRKAYSLIFERLTATLVSILRKGNTTSISMENRCFGAFKTRTNMVKIEFNYLDFIIIVISITSFLFYILYFLRILPIPYPPSLYSIFMQLL